MDAAPDDRLADASRSAVVNVTFRQLEVFLAVARRGHVGHAADELHMSPSAVSSAIASLEKTLSKQLFDRVGRGIQLNAEGQRILAHARRTIDSARLLESTAAGELSGDLVIGASRTIASIVLAVAMATFGDPWKLHLRLDVGNSRDIRDRLLAHALDAAYVEAPVEDSRLKAVPWRTDRLVVFCGPRHELASGGRLTRDDLKRQWVIREEGSATRESFMRALGDDVAMLGPMLEVASNTGVVRAVEAGGGLGCLSHMALRIPLAAGRIHQLDAPDWDLNRTLWHVWHRDHTPNTLAEAFHRHLESSQPGP